jgi:hypothetical protein
MAPKKTVATADRATRGTTRFTVKSSGGRSTDLTSKPIDSACGSTITSKSLRPRGAKNLRQGSQQASSTEVADFLRSAGRKERRLTKMADVVDEDTGSLDDEVEDNRCTVLTDEGRESSSTPTVTRGKVTDSKSAGRERCRTRLVRSSSMEVSKGRAARSKLAHAADYGQCDRRRRMPAEAALSRRERAEEEDVSDRSVDSDILDGTRSQHTHDTCGRADDRNGGGIAFDDDRSPDALGFEKLFARKYRRSLSADRVNVATAPDAIFARPRPVENSIAVPQYDGTGDLELFIKRFFSVSSYYRWTEGEQLFRLEHCLTDDAQYVLVDAPATNNIEEFVQILRSRFGLVTNAEQHRSELSRLRRGSKSIQELYLVVRRLVNKAFPGEWTMLTEIYARDAFLNALDDSDLRRRIIMSVPPPETLAGAYDLAVRALAVEESSGNQHFISTHENHRSRQEHLHARALKGTDSDLEKEKKQQEKLVNLRKQVHELQAALAERDRDVNGDIRSAGEKSRSASRDRVQGC